MSQHSQLVFEFSTFRLDADAFILYHGDEIIRGPEKHSLEVLAAIISSPNQVATYEEIISRVWPNVQYGVDSSRVNQHISKLRRILSSHEPQIQFFENLRGRGYRFVEPVTIVRPTKVFLEQPGVASSQIDVREEAKPASRGHRSWGLIALGATIIATAVIGGLWFAFSKSDTDEVAKVIKDSQIFESMVLYKHPERFQETDLDKYWTPEFDLTVNFDRTRINQAIKKLVSEQRRYGDETKCEQFDFQSVHIDKNGEQATARTLEKWMVAEYRTTGELLGIKNVGPYFVDYLLRKVDGRWLIERSTTARMVRPTPRIQNITFVGPPKAGKDFAISIEGDDFEPLTVYLEVIGDGCPEVKPCKIENGALLERSKLSQTKLENVPLPLAAGEYKVLVRNGDSRPSNPVTILVP